MFYVKGNPIISDELEVLQELKTQLALNGIERFNQFRRSGSNIQFNCPIHNNGQEHKPSCGISTVSSSTVPAGTVHCFTCGYTASLSEMISNCFGYDDNGVFGERWLAKNFLTLEVESRPDIILDTSRNSRRSAATASKYVPESELASYRYFHDYMYKRKLTDLIIEMFDVGYDAHFELKNKKNNTSSFLRCITFPVRDITGGTLFIARRSVDTKFFHYPEGVDKPLYGVYELSKYAPEATEVILCESIINALTCWVYGYPAIALNGTGGGIQYDQLRKLNYRKYITALDPDKAGRAGTQRLYRALAPYKLVSSLVVPEGKDINDLSKVEFENLPEIKF